MIAIEMRVDGRPVQIHFERNTDRLSYIPSELNAGEHSLAHKATDRAKNSVYHHQTFFTSDIFDFVDVVTFYPNPAKYEVKIGFNLTKPAGVTLKIHDAGGQLVHTVEWQDVTGKPSGTSTGKFYWNCQNQAVKVWLAVFTSSSWKRLAANNQLAAAENLRLSDKRNARLNPRT